MPTIDIKTSSVQDLKDFIKNNGLKIKVRHRKRAELIQDLIDGGYTDKASPIKKEKKVSPVKSNTKKGITLYGRANMKWKDFINTKEYLVDGWNSKRDGPHERKKISKVLLKKLEDAKITGDGKNLYGKYTGDNTDIKDQEYFNTLIIMEKELKEFLKDDDVMDQLEKKDIEIKVIGVKKDKDGDYTLAISINGKEYNEVDFYYNEEDERDELLAFDDGMPIFEMNGPFYISYDDEIIKPIYKIDKSKQPKQTPSKIEMKYKPQSNIMPIVKEPTNIQKRVILKTPQQEINDKYVKEDEIRTIDTNIPFIKSTQEKFNIGRWKSKEQLINDLDNEWTGTLWDHFNGLEDFNLTNLEDKKDLIIQNYGKKMYKVLHMIEHDWRNKIIDIELPDKPMSLLDSLMSDSDDEEVLDANVDFY